MNIFRFGLVIGFFSFFFFCDQQTHTCVNELLNIQAYFKKITIYIKS